MFKWIRILFDWMLPTWEGMVYERIDYTIDHEPVEPDEYEIGYSAGLRGHDFSDQEIREMSEEMVDGFNQGGLARDERK